MVSGSTQGLDGSDCSPGAGCQSSGESIFSQTPWRAYAESMPGPCAQENQGDYAPRHNPAVYFTRSRPPARERRADRAAPARPAKRRPRAVHLHHPEPLLRRARLPDLRRRPLARPLGPADRRLAGLPRGNDRRSSSPTTRTTTTRRTACTPWSSPRRFRPAPWRRDAFTHYSLLRTQEELLGLPFLGQAASAAEHAHGLRPRLTRVCDNWDRG